MSAWTLLEGKAFARDNDWDDSSARGTRNIVKLLNDARSAMAQAAKWDFDQRIGKLVFKAVYSTGTVDITAGGTAVTGHGTTFTAAMVGRYIRFQNEREGYLISAYGSATGITIEAYNGDTNLSGVTFEITNERVALPARFRDFEKPILVTEGWNLEPAPSLNYLQQLRIFATQTGTPMMYAVEAVETSSIPAPYVWLYPSPASQRTLQFVYYAWPQEAASDSDDFNLPALESARRVHRLYIRAMIKEQQGKTNESGPMLSFAQSEAKKVAGQMRPIREPRQRRIWSAEHEGGGISNDPLNVQWAPGEPTYTG